MGADTLARALALNALGGAQGPTGVTGVTGVTGPQGPTGPAGSGGGSDPLDNVKYVVNQIKGGYYDTSDNQWKEGVVAITGYNWEENGTQMSFNLGGGNIFQSNSNSLQYVDISKTNITSTPAYGFVQGCTKITTLKLPTTLYDFGLAAFFATQMSEIHIPYSYDGTHKVSFKSNVCGGDSAVTDIYFNVEKDNFTPESGWTNLNNTFGNHLYNITLHFTDQDITVPANPSNP